jgi:hypothetical protein
MTGGPMGMRNARIPMRDGIELAATLYLPAAPATEDGGDEVLGGPLLDGNDHARMGADFPQGP